MEPTNVVSSASDALDELWFTVDTQLPEGEGHGLDDEERMEDGIVPIVANHMTAPLGSVRRLHVLGITIKGLDNFSGLRALCLEPGCAGRRLGWLGPVAAMCWLMWPAPFCLQCWWAVA